MTTPTVTLPAAKAAGVKTEPISAAAASARTLRDGIGGHVTVGTLSLARIRLLPRAIVELVAALDSTLRKRALKPPRTIVETADVAITGGLLMERDLVTANSPHLFQREIDSDAFCILPLALPAASCGVGIPRRTGSPPSVAAELLMQRLRAAS